MVSIVVPVYNVEKYLKQCVDSILAQSYDDYEIILVDDGSTDSSGKICDSYEKSSSKIRAIHKANAGLGLARNTGMEEAKGDFVTFLDSDDYWSEDALEKLMTAIAQNGADTAVGGYTRVKNSGEIVLSSAPEPTVYKTADEVKTGFFPRLMGSAPNKKDAFRPSVWNAVYSMKVIREHGVRFPSEREYIAEDIVFDIDYYRFSRCVCLVDSAGYFYRVTPGSLTQTYKPDRFEKVVCLYQEVFKRLKAYGYEEICALRANRQFFVYVKACIKQESVAISGKTKRTALQNIKNICSAEFTQHSILRYPVEKLGIPQRGFLFLVKNKKARMLYVLVCQNKKRGGKA